MRMRHASVEARTHDRDYSSAETHRGLLRIVLDVQGGVIRFFFSAAILVEMHCPHAIFRGSCDAAFLVSFRRANLPSICLGLLGMICPPIFANCLELCKLMANYFGVCGAWVCGFGFFLLQSV